MKRLYNSACVFVMLFIFSTPIVVAWWQPQPSIPIPPVAFPHVDTVGLPNNAQMMRNMIHSIPQNGDIVLSDGEWNLTSLTLWLPRLANVSGMGRDRTKIISTNYTSSAFTCIVETNSNRVRDLTIESRVTQGQQSQTIGHQGAQATSDNIDWVDNCRIIGHSFAYYFWGGSRNRGYVSNSEIFAGKWGVTAGVGSGPDDVKIDIHNTDILCDYKKYPGAGGDQGNTVGGIVARGGVVRMYGGSITVIGDMVPGTEPPTPLDFCACAWSTPQPGPVSGYPPDADWPLIELYNVDFSTTANGARQSADCIAQVGRIECWNCTGSGPNGQVTTIGNVIVHKDQKNKGN